MDTEILKIILQLFGGLALFIYGMNLMSDGLQKAAGSKLKNVLALLTKNVFIGVLAGAATTAVLQSSSAVTVMVIGFVSARLMTLRQAISIIMGANIGTCITAQLVAFKIGDYSWAFVITGFIMFFFISKYEKIRDIGQAIFAFGVLFSGLNIMSAAMDPLSQSQFFADIMLKVADVPALGVLVGAVMTTVMQSSSASIAVLQNLAGMAGPDGVSSIIGLAGAIPILYGTNIGTTTTALLASIGGSISAKRTAISHTIFNITGTLLLIWFVGYIADFVTMISPGGDELDIISRQIANAHLLFNIVTTIVFLPLIGTLVKIVTRIVPGDDEEKTSMQTMYLDYNVLEQPFAAIHLATKEIARMAEMTSQMIVDTRKAFIENDRTAAETVIENDKAINHLRDMVVKYLSSIFPVETVTEHQSVTISGLMHVVSDVEHIGDYCKNIAWFAKDKIDRGYEFSEHAYSEIDECFDFSSRMVSDAIEALNSGNVLRARHVKEQQESMEALEERLRGRHMKRLNSRKCSPEFSVIYTDVIADIRNIGHSCANISNAVLRDINFRDLRTEEI